MLEQAQVASMAPVLEDEREEISRVDEEIVEKVKERMDHVVKIAEYKTSKDVDIVDEGREREVEEHFKTLFDEADLPPERGKELARLLINTAVDVEEEMIGK